MIDEIPDEKWPGFHPRNRPAFGIRSKTGRPAIRIAREHFDGEKKLAGLAVFTDSECLKGAVGERVAAVRHLSGADPARTQMGQQFLAGDAAAPSNLFDSATQFSSHGGVIGDLKNLKMPDKLLPLFGSPVFNFVANFGVTHAARVPQPTAAAIPIFARRGPNGSRGKSRGSAAGG